MKTKSAIWIFLLTTFAALFLPQQAGALGACTCARCNDFKDHGCHQPPGGAGSPGANVNNAGGNNAACTNCTGMPRWSVSEPYINLHVVDEPLSYKTSSGETMSFRWYYKQRYMLPQNDQIPSFNMTETLGTRLRVFDEFYNFYQVRSYGDTNAFYSGMTNASWSHSWMMDIIYWDASWEAAYQKGPYPPPGSPFATNYEALLFTPDGGIDYFTYNVANQTLNAPTQTNDPISQVRLSWLSGTLTSTATAAMSLPDGHGIYWGSATNGLMLLYPDGSKDIFGLGWMCSEEDVGDSTTHALLTQRVDPQGRVTLIGYELGGTNLYTGLRVKYVVDSDGRTSTFFYANNPTNVWQLQEIDDPFGRKATFARNTKGWLDSITDAVTNTSTFSYTATVYNGVNSSNGWMSSLTTPYGTTQFFYQQVTDQSAPTNYQQRALYVTEPDGASQLYCYIHNTSTSVESSAIAPSVTGRAFDNGLDGGVDPQLYHRNSFYWNREQTPNLSIYSNLPYGLSCIYGLNTNDFLKGRMRHWFLDTDQISLTEILSSERDPSPDDGGTTEGTRTWYSYTNANAIDIASNLQISCIAQILPDGTSQYTRYQYYSTGLVSQNEQSYSLPGGGIGELTNWFNYPAHGLELTANGLVTGNYVDLMSVSNSFGQYVNFGYNAWHEVVAMTNSLSQVATFGWNSNTLNLTNATLFDGQTFALSYNSTNPVTASSAFLNQITVQPENRTTSITAYANGLPQSVQVTGTGVPALSLTYNWDGLNRLTGTVYQDGTSISNIYTKLDLSAHKDRVSNWTYYAHDGLQHLTSITDARSNITQFSWCNCGSLTSISNALGNLTYLNYNNQGLLTNVNFPDNSRLNWQYDLSGRMTQRSDGSGSFWNYSYNNQNLVTAISNTYGQMFGAAYDAAGRPVIVTNANNVVVTNGYDLLNRLTNRAWIGGGNEYFAYATNGLTAYTNQDGQWTLFGRDAASRLTALTNAVQTNLFAYDPLDDLVTLTDGLNNKTTWTFNQYRWLTSKANTYGATIMTNGYDPDGRVTNRWMMGTSTGYAYDAAGNLTNIIYPTATYICRYDAINELTNIVDSFGATAFTYTPTGQLSSETVGPWSNSTVTNVYNQAHRDSLTLSQPSGGLWSQTYAYDAAWRMTGITSPVGTFAYQYPSGVNQYLVGGISLPNGTTINNQYDTLSRLTNTALVNYWGHILDGYIYGLDLLGQRTNLTRELGLTTNVVFVGYDPIGQLTSWTAKEANGTPRQNEQLSYAYDAANNVHLRTNNALTQTFIADPLNQLSNVTRSGTLTVSGALPVPPSSVTVNGANAQINGDFTFAAPGNTLANGSNTFTIVARNVYGSNATEVLSLNLAASVNFQYDANGNLTNDGTRVFYYDAENQLTNVTVAGQWRTTNLFDGLRRRRITGELTWQNSAWVQTNQIRYVYDGPLVIQERDTNNNPQVTYTRGLDLSLSLRGAGGIGGLLARTDSNGPACYHSDGNGNITALIDADQYVAARYEYDPYGRLIGKWGRLADANRYRFSSKEYQPASGLYYYGYRFYEPNFGRWLNHDPLGEVGGVNLYGFNGNNPVNFVDPYGLLSWGDFNPGLLLSGQAWGQLAHNVFMGDHPEPALDPNSLQALQNAAGVGVTPLTDENGNQITPNQALGQMAQDALGDAAQLAMMLPLGPEEAAGAAAEDAAKAAKTAKEAKASTPCPATPKWKMPTQKGAPKMQRQMQQRGWTPQDITDAMEKGQKFPAPNNVNPANAATRYVNPTTGQSVVVDDITGEVLHVGGPGFKY